MLVTYGFFAVVWADQQNLRRISISIQVHDHERVVDRMNDIGLTDSMSRSGPVELHTGSTRYDTRQSPTDDTAYAHLQGR